MFSSLLFLALVLLISSSGVELAAAQWNSTPLEGFVAGTLFYGAILILIRGQCFLLRSRPRWKQRLLFAAQLEACIGLLGFYFFFGGQRLLLLFTPSLLVLALWPLALYFLALWIAHQRREPLQFLFPFTLPYLLLCAFLDALQLLGTALPTEESWSLLIGGGISLLWLIGSLIFLPWAMVRLWGCRPLSNQALHARLETLCQQARFRHAGIVTWAVMNQHITAGIIGIVPKFRYVLFTEPLLTHLSPEAVETVLAHEIGHSRHRHLLWYPLILFGALICMGLSSQLFSPAIEHYLQALGWERMTLFALFIPDLLIFAVYFRFVFGLFSRLFERQADLTPLELGLSASATIEALDQVARLAGNIHRVPSWHHYSIQQRIQVIEHAAQHPEDIAQHGRLVRHALTTYCVLLVLGLLLLFAPELPEVWPFHPIAVQMQHAALWIDQLIHSLI